MTKTDVTVIRLFIDYGPPEAGIATGGALDRRGALVAAPLDH